MIKHTHKEVPATHYFPDGSKISYWRDNLTLLVRGQLFDKKGRRVRRPFKYLGDTP